MDTDTGDRRGVIFAVFGGRRRTCWVLGVGCWWARGVDEGTTALVGGVLLVSEAADKKAVGSGLVGELVAAAAATQTRGEVMGLRSSEVAGLRGVLIIEAFAKLMAL